MPTLQQLITRFSHLPASAVAVRLNDALKSNARVVLTAPPGAGKSTLLPLTMLAGGIEGKIVMLEPRRLAARQIALRMAVMLGEEVGQTVGYRIRFESRTSAATRIEVLTEGILTRMLVDDATLDGVGAVVFDEFHERSLHSDLALALTRRTQDIIRPDLRLVVMSATIDARTLCTKLGAPLVESEGRMFPVDIRYADTEATPADTARATAAAIREAYAAHEGDILAFLPGQREIDDCAALLGDTLAPTRVFPLYGNLTAAAQHAAIASSAPGERKVVLATNIAETSLTIESVRIVVDAGWCRRLAFDARTGLSHLQTVRISRDMATQRAGRAGRVAEGVCIRLWPQTAEHFMAAQRTPEVEEADLAPMLLETAAFGEQDAAALPWVTPPPASHLTQARELLLALGAIRPDGGITPRGKRMAELPCHPRMASMMMHAGTAALTALACDVAALLEEKDPMTGTPDSDLSLRVSELRRLRREGKTGRWARIAQIAREYRRMTHTAEDNTDAAPTDVGRLLAYAYPERVGKAHDHIGTYRLAGGQEVRLDGADAMAGHEWIVAASLHTGNSAAGRVFLAAPLAPSDLEADGSDGLICERDHMGWDSREGCVTMLRERRIGRLVVDSRPLPSAQPEEVATVVCEAVAKEGLGMLAWTDEVQRLQRRIAQVAEWHPELGIPDVTTPHLLATATDWLLPYLHDGGRVKQTVAELRRIDLAEAIWNALPYPIQQEIDRLAPTHIAVPTGSRICVDYRQGTEAPVLSVRLQECFGLTDTPRVDDGRRPVLMELLSPGFKPVQLTQDLASFWQHTYFEVRKELRRRYPKHYWPENPLEAEAVRGVKRRNQ